MQMKWNVSLSDVKSQQYAMNQENDLPSERGEGYLGVIDKGTGLAAGGHVSGGRIL